MTIEEDNTKTHRMAEEKIEVSVVMLCLNEQATISYCIEKAQKPLKRWGGIRVEPNPLLSVIDNVGVEARWVHLIECCDFSANF